MPKKVGNRRARSRQELKAARQRRRAQRLGEDDPQRLIQELQASRAESRSSSDEGGGYGRGLFIGDDPRA